jgi:hypothetical protein
MKPGFQRVRTRWNPGFIAFQRNFGPENAMLMVSV